MTHIVDCVTAYDSKRMKVTLDNGGVAFILYKGEFRNLQLSEGKELSEEDLSALYRNILLPRAKKRSAYYLKNGDKTEFQIRRKLKEGCYPDPVIEETIECLRHYKFADDERYAENMLDSLRGKYSRKEIESKLYMKGLPAEIIREMVSQITPEEEEEACVKALRKKCTGDRRKDFSSLLRKGFSYEACEHALSEAGAYEEEESFL